MADLGTAFPSGFLDNTRLWEFDPSRLALCPPSTYTQLIGNCNLSKILKQMSNGGNVCRQSFPSIIARESTLKCYH